MLRSISATITFNTLQDFLFGTVAGKSLAESCSGLELPLELQKWNVLGTQNEVDANYFLGDITYNTIYEGVQSRSVSAPTSPSKDEPAWSVSIVCANKLSPFGQTITDDTTELIKWCVIRLIAETGQPWNRGDIFRLWNLDVFSFPYANIGSGRKVEAHLNGSIEGLRDECTISISDGALETGTNLLVNLRLVSGEGILFDRTVQIITKAGNTGVTFDQLPDRGVIELRIWVMDNTGSYRIWFSKEYAFIQSINIGMGVVGLQGNIDSAWLRLIKSGALAKRASKLRRLQQVTYSQIGVGKNPSPAVSSLRQSQQLSKVLFPSHRNRTFLQRAGFETNTVNLILWNGSERPQRAQSHVDFCWWIRILIKMDLNFCYE